MSSGSDLIAAERRRQIEKEGFTISHDDEHTNSELVDAAIGYAKTAELQVQGYVRLARCEPADWPWESEWWKPSDDPIRNLVKAGALIAAEIDRLQRSGK